MKLRVLFGAAALLCLASPVFASGFRLADQSASALGMAGAFAGQADDPSAAWYNPAGIAGLSGTRMSAGLITVYPAIKHETPSGPTEVSERDLHLLPHLFLTHRLNDTAAAGIAVVSPFGLSTNWSDDSSVRYVSTLSKVVTTEINPSLAVRVTDKLSAAIGVDYLRLRAVMNNALTMGPLGDHTFGLSGDGGGWGANAALLYRPSSATGIGLSYRSRIKVRVNGEASEDAPAPYGLSNTATADITLPDLVEAGISQRVTDRLTVNADLDYTLWSTYDRLVIRSNTILGLTSATPDPTDTTVDEMQWKDAWCIRVGGQYMLNDRWKLRAGTLYDRNPVPTAHFDTRVPDADRYGITLGAGYGSGAITVDVAYLYLAFRNRAINDSTKDDLTPDPAVLNGTYRSQAHLAGVTIGYAF